MGILSKLIKKVTPKVLKAVIVGGSKTERAILKSQITNPMFEPIYQKFGDSVEKGAKLAVAIGATALTLGAAAPIAAGAGGAGGLTGILKGKDLLTASSGNTGIAGGVLNQLAPTKNSGMSLLGTLAKGIFNEAKPALADLAKSSLGKLFQGVTNAPGSAQASPPSIQPVGKNNFFTDNKKWLVPLGWILGLGAVLWGIIKAFGRRRR